jgi:hypothetical protein
MSFLDELPEDIRENEHLSGIENAEQLARSLVELKSAAPPDWKTLLSDELKTEKSLEQFKDVPSLAKSYVETKRKVGDALHIPDGEDNEAWQEVFTKLGRPEKAEDYQLPQPDLPEGVPWDEDRAKRFGEVAHSLGLSQKQLEGIVQWDAQETRNFFVTGKAELEAVVEGLKKDWGANFDRNIALAQRTVRAVGGDEVVALLDSTGLNNHPALAKMFSRIGKTLAEAGVIDGEVVGTVAPEDAKSRIAAILTDKKDPYWQASDPQHRERTEEVRKLYEIAYPQTV